MRSGTDGDGGREGKKERRGERVGASGAVAERCGKGKGGGGESEGKRRRDASCGGFVRIWRKTCACGWGKSVGRPRSGRVLALPLRRRGALVGRGGSGARSGAEADRNNGASMEGEEAEGKERARKRWRSRALPGRRGELPGPRPGKGKGKRPGESVAESSRLPLKRRCKDNLQPQRRSSKAKPTPKKEEEKKKKRTGQAHARGKGGRGGSSAFAGRRNKGATQKGRGRKVRWKSVGGRGAVQKAQEKSARGRRKGGGRGGAWGCGLSAKGGAGKGRGAGGAVFPRRESVGRGSAPGTERRGSRESVQSVGLVERREGVAIGSKGEEGEKRGRGSGWR